MKRATLHMLVMLLTMGASVRAIAVEPELNKLCPVMTEEAADPEITVTYRGKTVAFCCDRCVRKFNGDPEKYLPNLPQFAGLVGGFASEAESSPPPSSGSDPGDAAAEGSLPDAAKSIWGRLHPAIVHFPVAGLPLAFIGLLIWSITAREAFAKADVVALIPAALTSVAAVLTGNIAEEGERFSAAMHEIAERHESLSTAVMILALVLTAFRVWRWNSLRAGWRWVYGVGLCAASVLVGATGYLGGSLVFGPDHLKW